MIDWTKPVRTRHGKPVEILSIHGKAPRPIVGYIEGIFEPITWNINGKYYEFGNDEFDLENAPEPVKTQEVWANVYKSDKGNLYLGMSWQSKADAKLNKHELWFPLVGRNKVIARAEFDE